MSFLKLEMVNKNGVRVFHAPNKTREQVREYLHGIGSPMMDEEISTGEFVTESESAKRTSCVMIGLDQKNPIWFDEAFIK